MSAVMRARLVSGRSNSEVLGDAIASALRDASKQLPEGTVPSFCFLFVSSSYCNVGEAGGVLVTEDTRVFQQGSEKYSRAMSLISRNFLQRGWNDVPIAGCSVGGSILGTTENVGKDSGVCVVLANLPDSEVSPFFVKPESFNDGWRQSDWEKAGISASFQPSQGASGDDAVLFMFGHPEESTFIRKVLDSLDFVFPSARKIGALAGRTMDTHEREFFFLPSLKDVKDISSLEQCCFSEGLAGIAFRGGIAADAVVAQGSRPIGPNYEVLGTEMNGTIITRMREIGTTEEAEGAPMVLFELAVFAGTIDQQSFIESTRFLALGTSLTPLEDEADKHQYIVRPILNVEKDGPVFLADGVRVGQVVRFHIRDAANAEQELQQLRMRWKLERNSRKVDKKLPAGALLFADQARGPQLYGRENVENAGFVQDFPDVPLGGGYFDGVIGQLPNFQDKNKAPLLLDADKKPQSTGVLFDQLERGTYVHTMGSAFLLLYGQVSVLCAVGCT